MRYHVTAVLAAALVAGCGGSSDEAKQRTISCDFSGGGTCQTISGMMANSEVGGLQAECGSMGGRFFDGACTTSGMVPGHCRVDLGSGVVDDVYYDTDRWTPGDAQSNCITAPPIGTWDGGSFHAALQGSWSECKDGGGGTSTEDTLTFSALSLTVTSLGFPNATCAGVGTPGGGSSGTIVLGYTASAALGSATVTATELDLVFGGVTSYTIAYVDEAATPDRLYLGDTSGANDGTTKATRPTALEAGRYLTRR